MSDNIRWVATLSDGTTAVEHAGEYTVVPGERKPWVRLASFLANNDLHLTSLRLNFRGRTIHMPRENFDRFNLGNVSRAPAFYSLQYLIEGNIDTASGIFSQQKFIDLIAHYDSFEVHYLQDLEKGDNSWVIVTEGLNTMAPTPRKK
jgi:hypothetical protein